MNRFAGRIDALQPTNPGDNWHDGFYAARDEAAYIAETADELIEKLLDALDNRNAGDYVDRIKEEYGIA